MNIDEIGQEKILLSELTKNHAYIQTLLSKVIERDGTIQELYYGHQQMVQDLKAAREEIAKLMVELNLYRGEPEADTGTGAAVE